LETQLSLVEIVKNKIDSAVASVTQTTVLLDHQRPKSALMSKKLPPHLKENEPASVSNKLGNRQKSGLLKAKPAIK
jgi:hypothetical protein